MPEVHIDTARAHRLWPIVLKRIKTLIDQQNDVMLLVPEQFSISAESEVLNGLQIDSSLHLEVCTPSRLYQRYVRLGDVTSAPLEETGFHMAVAQALESVREQLEYYRYSSHDPGFLQRICSLITDMRHSSISPVVLMKYAEDANDMAAKAKFHDLAHIYEQYIRVMNGRFSDGEDRLAFLGSLLLKTESLANLHVIVFGFDTLTRQMMSLLTAIAKQCQTLNIVLCCDYRSADDGRLFTPVYYSISTFLSILQTEGIYAISEHHAGELSDSHPVFRYLDHQLFNNDNKNKPYPADSGETVPLLTIRAATPIEEIKWIARNARALIDTGIDPSEICVMYPKNSMYDALIPLTLAEYGIPCFANPKLHLRNHRLPQFLVSALRCMADGWNRDDVLEVLHSGYSSLTADEAAAFESYIISNNINHNRFLQPFNRGKDQAVTAQAEELRKKWLEPMLSCRESIVNAGTGTASVKAIYQLLLDVHAKETYQEAMNQMRIYGLFERYKQEQPIWECIVRVLEQMALVAENNRIPLKHIAFRLQSGLDAVTMAILPYGSSHVQAGYIGHMIQLQANYVFLCGLNDGTLETESVSLIEREKSALEAYSECAIGQTDRSTLTENMLSLKTAMLLPKKRLYLSCCLCNEKGESQSPLRCLDEALDHLIPKQLRMTDVPEKLPVSLPDLAARLRSDAKAISSDAIIESFHLNSREIEFLRSSLTPPHHETNPALSAKLAEKLYHTEAMSISQLEKYQSCPYQYFLHYGIKPSKPENWSISSSETGTFYHDAVHQFTEALKATASPESLCINEVRNLAQNASAPFADNLLNGPYGDGAFAQAKWKEVQQNVLDTAEIIWKQLLLSKFEIWKTETTFGYPGGMPPIVLVLENGRQILLRGRIDRIDRLQNEEETLLSVVDYKSSNNDIDSGKAWAGLQLQLMLYLLACTQAQPNAKPAGAFYFWIHPAFGKSESDLQEHAEKAIQKAFHMRGLVLTDIITKEIQEAKELTSEQMNQMLKLTYTRAAEICQHLLNGAIAPIPFQIQENLPCRYCDYIRDCRFSPKAEAKKIRTLPSLSFDELLQKLTESSETTKTT